MSFSVYCGYCIPPLCASRRDLRDGRSETFENAQSSRAALLISHPFEETVHLPGVRSSTASALVLSRATQTPSRSEGSPSTPASCAQLIASASPVSCVHIETRGLTRATSCLVVQITAHRLPTKRPRLPSFSNLRATLFPLSLPALSLSEYATPGRISHGRRDRARNCTAIPRIANRSRACSGSGQFLGPCPAISSLRSTRLMRTIDRVTPSPRRKLR